MLVKWRNRAVFYVVLLCFLFVVLFPIYWMIRTSLIANIDLFKYTTYIWPPNVTLGAYERVFSGTPVARWYWNSIFVTSFTVLATVPIAAMAGYALSRFRKIEITIVASLILLAKMLPVSLLTIPLYAIFARFHLLENLFCLVIANTTFAIPFCTWMLKGFFDTIPRDLEAAAYVDGCGLLRAFVRITLPLSMPGLAAATIYTTVVSWGEYIFARTLMSKPTGWTAGVGIVSFRMEYTVQWNEVMAASVVFTLPLVLVFVFLQRYLIKGLTAGAIK